MGNRVRRVKEADVIELGSLVIDTDEQRVWLDGRPIRLTRAEIRIHICLAASPYSACSRQQLMSEALGYPPGARTRTIDVHCSRLRRKLPGVALTAIWGDGYRLG